MMIILLAKIAALWWPAGNRNERRCGGLCTMRPWFYLGRWWVKVKGEGPGTWLHTGVRLKTRRQKRCSIAEAAADRYELVACTGYSIALYGNPLPALTNGRTYNAASKYTSDTTVLISHIRPSSKLFSTPLLARTMDKTYQYISHKDWFRCQLVF